MSTTQQERGDAVLDDENGGLDDERLKRLARAGFVAKGWLYAVIGLLAGQLAFGSASQEASQSGAMDTLARQPFGAVLLGATAIGMFAYAAYRFVLVWTGPDSDTSMPDWFARVTFFVRGVIYVGLGVLASKELFGSGSSSSSGNQGATAKVLEWPAGTWLVGAVGLTIAIVGVVQLVYAVRVEWEDRLDELGMGPAERRWTHRIGQVGHVGRALVYALTGWFVIQAAITHDPQKGGGLDTALSEVRQTAWGTGVLAFVALSLVAYGVFCVQEGRHRDL